MPQFAVVPAVGLVLGLALSSTLIGLVQAQAAEPEQPALVGPPPPPLAARPAPTAAIFRLDPAGALSSGHQTARKGSSLLTLAVRSEAAVRLEAPVDARAANWLGGKLKRPLIAGQVLMAAAGQQGTYCAPVKDGALYAVGPCLIDGDGDGRFEAAATAEFNSGSVQGLMVTDRGDLLGVNFVARTALSTPVAYSSVPYQQGSAANARLMWRTAPDRGVPGAAVPIIFWLEASDGDSGTRVLSPAAQTTLQDGVGTGRLGGVTVRVLGLEQNGALRYQIEAVTPGFRLPFGFRPAPSVVYIGY